ncbi:hypothetical protein AB0I28_15795 [Phytomonospora sp. NPDC050363]|uniref:hypothetical protein n=1 Tax=Phytomonospora sp. NPDC050363 TaxID=3155642 RepID=UPI0033C65567
MNTARPRRLAIAATAALLALTACSPDGRVTPHPSGSAAPGDGVPADGAGPAFYYLGSTADFASTSVYRLADGKVEELVELEYSAAWLSANISADGSVVSYVTMEGRLNVIETEPGGVTREVVSDADPMCVEPVWSPQGHLLYGHFSRDSGMATVHIAEPGADVGPPMGESGDCHYRYSADGTKIVVGALGDGDVSIMDADLSNARDDTFEIPGRVITDLSDVGPGAARICVSTVADGDPVGDVARTLACDTVIDTATGEVVPLPMDGVLGVRFAPDGSMLVRTEGELTFVGADGTPGTTIPEPAEFADYALLDYVP